MSDGEILPAPVTGKRGHSPEPGDGNATDSAPVEEDERLEQPPLQRRRINHEYAANPAPPIEDVKHAPQDSNAGASATPMQIDIGGATGMPVWPQTIAVEARAAPHNLVQEIRGVFASFLDALVKPVDETTQTAICRAMRHLHRRIERPSTPANISETLVEHLPRVVHLLANPTVNDGSWAAVFRIFLSTVEAGLDVDDMFPQRGSHITLLRTLHLHCIRQYSVSHPDDVLAILRDTRLRSKRYLREASKEVSTLMACLRGLQDFVDDGEFIIEILRESGDLTAYVEAGGLDGVLVLEGHDEALEDVLIECFEALDVDLDVVSRRIDGVLASNKDLFTPAMAYIMCGIARRISGEQRQHSIILGHLDVITSVVCSEPDPHPRQIELLAHVVTSDDIRALPDWEYALLVLRRDPDGVVFRHNSEISKNVLIYFVRSLGEIPGTDRARCVQGLSEFLFYEDAVGWSLYSGALLGSRIFSDSFDDDGNYSLWLNQHPGEIFLNGFIFESLSDLGEFLHTDVELCVVEDALIACLELRFQSRSMAKVSRVNCAAIRFLTGCLDCAPWPHSRFGAPIRAFLQFCQACCGELISEFPLDAVTLVSEIVVRGVLSDPAPLLTNIFTIKTIRPLSVDVFQNLIHGGFHVPVLSAMCASLKLQTTGRDVLLETLTRLCGICSKNLDIVNNFDHLPSLQLAVIEGTRKHSQNEEILVKCFEFFTCTRVLNDIARNMMQFLVSLFPTRDAISDRTRRLNRHLHMFREKFGADALFIEAGGIEAMLGCPCSESYLFLSALLQHGGLRTWNVTLTRCENILFESFRKFLTGPTDSFDSVFSCLRCIWENDDEQIRLFFLKSEVHVNTLFNVIYSNHAQLPDTVVYRIAAALCKLHPNDMNICHLSVREKAELLVVCLNSAERLKWEAVATVLRKLGHTFREIHWEHDLDRGCWISTAIHSIESALVKHVYDVKRLEVAVMETLSALTISTADSWNDIREHRNISLVLLWSLEGKSWQDVGKLLDICDWCFKRATPPGIIQACRSVLMGITRENLLEPIATHAVRQVLSGAWKLTHVADVLLLAHNASHGILWEAGMTPHRILQGLAQCVWSAPPSMCALVSATILQSSSCYEEEVSAMTTTCDAYLSLLETSPPPLPKIFSAPTVAALIDLLVNMCQVACNSDDASASNAQDRRNRVMRLLFVYDGHRNVATAGCRFVTMYLDYFPLMEVTKFVSRICTAFKGAPVVELEPVLLAILERLTVECAHELTGMILHIFAIDAFPTVLRASSCKLTLSLLQTAIKFDLPVSFLGAALLQVLSRPTTSADPIDFLISAIPNGLQRCWSAEQALFSLVDAAVSEQEPMDPWKLHRLWSLLARLLNDGEPPNLCTGQVQLQVVEETLLSVAQCVGKSYHCHALGQRTVWALLLEEPYAVMKHTPVQFVVDSILFGRPRNCQFYDDRTLEIACITNSKPEVFSAYAPQLLEVVKQRREEYLGLVTVLASMEAEILEALRDLPNASRLEPSCV